MTNESMDRALGSMLERLKEMKTTTVPIQAIDKKYADQNGWAFHRLWTRCVGTEDYNKQEWLAIEKQLTKAKIIS